MGVACTDQCRCTSCKNGKCVKEEQDMKRPHHESYEDSGGESLRRRLNLGRESSSGIKNTASNKQNAAIHRVMQSGGENYKQKRESTEKKVKGVASAQTRKDKRYRD